MNADVARALGIMPLVGILRHLPVDAVEAVGGVLVDEGFTVVEVPLNDERVGLECIERFASIFAGTLVVGAGTVTDPAQVQRVADAGGRLVVSPDTNPGVIQETVRLGLFSCPGAATPTEAFTALRNGADVLKLFPASVYGPSGLRALGAVLPPGTQVYPVGGVSPGNVLEWRRAGAAGLGIGGALYRPGSSPEDARAVARAFTSAWQEAVETSPD